MIKPNYVLVIDTNKTPLTPCKPSVAKKLLKANKAAIYRRFPFTIILKKRCSAMQGCTKKECTSSKFQLELKIDPGSKTTGLALVLNNALIWCGDLSHRGSLIKKKLESRRASRRLRRSRLRYRQPRFLNRTRPKGWLPPSLMHRVETTMTWVKRLIKFSPVSSISTELVRFDTQKLENPEISGVKYQLGF